jgi:hypothetical protein
VNAEVTKQEGRNPDECCTPAEKNSNRPSRFFDPFFDPHRTCPALEVYLLRNFLNRPNPLTTFIFTRNCQRRRAPITRASLSRPFTRAPIRIRHKFPLTVTNPNPILAQHTRVGKPLLKVTSKTARAAKRINNVHTEAADHEIPTFDFVNARPGRHTDRDY